MNLTVVDHPLARHYLSILRDSRTEPEDFRNATRRLTYTLLMEATSDFKLTEQSIETPLEPTTGYRLERDIVAVAVLRAGLGLLEAVVDMLPGVRVGFAGLQRDEETAEAQEYYYKIPDITDAKVLVLEPMLATGGSLSWAVQRVKDQGGTDIIALCVVAAPEGVERMRRQHPSVPIVAAGLDRELDTRFYIRPGLGDMGDRLFGTL
ncbi:MAG: uracil phosphoribosyltransferase [Actinomycetota bacterium]|nr:uracil phosphoribosyltransferase [Actinomycetota bacterium]